MSKPRRKDTPLTPDELREVERRRAEVKARLRAAPHDETDPEEVDPENPPLSDDELDALRPAHAVHPELVARRLQRDGAPPTRATVPFSYVDKHSGSIDGSVTLEAGTIARVALDNITDVHSHVIMREGITHIHSIDFGGGGSIKLVYTSEGELKDFTCRGIDLTITGDNVVILKRRLLSSN